MTAGDDRQSERGAYIATAVVVVLLIVAYGGLVAMAAFYKYPSHPAASAPDYECTSVGDGAAEVCERVRGPSTNSDLPIAHPPSG
jgi:hypothetical protein